MSSILLISPACEPVSLDAAKVFLRVEHDDDDATIAALIASARLHVETQTRRALITQTWRLSRDVWPAGGAVPVLPAPLRELLAVRVYRSDGGVDVVAPENFAIDAISAPARLTFARGALPAPERVGGGIEFDVVVGYGDAPEDVPQPLRQAILLLVAHWYENRALIAAHHQVASVPSSILALIAPYRVVSL